MLNKEDWMYINTEKDRGLQSNSSSKSLGDNILSFLYLFIPSNSASPVTRYFAPEDRAQAMT